jgi:hypothetical protein
MQSISQLVKLVAALGFRSKGCISAEALDGRSLVSRQKDRGVTAGIGISPIPRQRNSAPEPLPESHAAQAHNARFSYSSHHIEALRAIRGACDWGSGWPRKRWSSRGADRAVKTGSAVIFLLATIERTVHGQICFLFCTYILTAQRPRIATALQTIRS